MSVGLAIIARDEAANLPWLLDSVRGAFDQVVLCDTGSTDGTVEVFEKWARAQKWPRHGFAPWKVSGFRWRDDFAAARNYADALLDTEWSSWADCDDVIRGAQNLRLLARTAPPTVAAFAAGYEYARLADGATIAYVRRERLVRRSRARGWVHRVHEHQLLDGDTELVRPDVCEWVHRKWTLEPGESVPAPERNVRILRQWVAEEPDHTYALSCLAQELHMRGAHREAVGWFRRFLDVDPRDAWPEYRVRILRHLATSHLLLGEPRAALRAARAAGELLPHWPDACLSLAEAHLALHRWRRAERLAREVLRLGTPETALKINPLDYTYAPRVILAGALAGRKRFGEAIAVGEEACELMPHHAELERQLQAWRHRRLGRQPAARRAAPQLAAAAAMVAGLLGTPTAAVAQPSGAHNELGATGFMGIPILAPSTTGSVRTIRIRNNVIGGAHQLQGSQYVPFVSVFNSSPGLVTSFVVGGFGQSNSSVTGVFPFDGTNFLGIDQTTSGRVAATTPFAARDTQCQTDLGARRPLFFGALPGTPFLLLGGDQLSAPFQGFVTLFNPFTCRGIASTGFAFDPAKPGDVGAAVFGQNGLLVAGAAGQAPDQSARWLYSPYDDWRAALFRGQASVPNAVVGNPGLAGTFTGGVPVTGGGFDIVGLDRPHAVVYGGCANAAGQPDPRCGPNGSRILLDLDPSRFSVSNPAITNGPNGPIVALPFQNLQDGSAHVLFENLDPATLDVRSGRDVLFPSTTRIVSLGTTPSGQVLFGVTARNLADPSNPLNNNRIGMGLLNTDLSLEHFLIVDDAPPGIQATAPSPRSIFTPTSPQLFTVGAGSHALPKMQAAAAGLTRIARVQIAVVRVSGHNASLRCAWLKDTRAHFVADTPVQNSCQGAHWITARKGHGTKWTLRLSRRLPRGQYVGYSRATNAAGVTQRQFTTANKRAFRVR